MKKRQQDKEDFAIIRCINYLHVCVEDTVHCSGDGCM